ncbi:hypothetical protein OX284_013640 [Flavobacterium sp. SUN046]|uniref:hypothetical protein n=1 Tax=Flavobacterium sp. SUN046 TaxID=3002440 RepID=UPI002DB9328D|nr:hypothetical protein [Flavobacterium sp. SUN046]MEC4050480.1 hypothetical protein [Flavobacterium sp. SUN046]
MKKKLIKSFYFIGFLFVVPLLWAQPGDQNGTGDLEGVDPPVASIDMFELFFMICVFIVAFCFFRKKIVNRIN